MDQPKTIAERYELHETIGQGGMGTVHRGHDTKTGEAVAIKALKPEIVQADPNMLERFEREGEALRLLNHPNIVSVMAAVEEDGNHYLVMEYVAGGTLADLMDEHRPMPIKMVLEIALDLADALTRAHRQKILHRDIKPANVLIAEDGTPRLTDFGVAQMQDRTRVTEAGMIVGTYNYLSPEAIGGDDLDERADIWAFGILLYEMLTGTRPFEEDSLAAIIGSILNKPTPDILEKRPDMPPSLVKLVYHMLEKDRDQRIDSVRLVGAEIESIIRGSDSNINVADSDLRQQVEERPRFATMTPTPTRSNRLYDVIKDDQGQEFVVIKKQRAMLLDVLTVLGIGLLILGIVLSISRRNATNDAENDPATTTVAPVAEGETMILVAAFEPLTDDTRDVARFVADNLQQTLEPLSFSALRIRQTGEVVLSEDAAREMAQENGAAVVVWGNYDDSAVTANITLGVTSEPLPIDQTIINRTANVRVSMENERQESVASMVLAALGVQSAAEGAIYEFMVTIAILDTLNVTNAEIVSTGVSGSVHRYFIQYFDDTEAALTEIDAAIDLDNSNPFLPIFSSIGNVRIGNLDDARRDAQSAQALAGDDWVLPYVLTSISLLEPEAVVENFNAAIAIRPDDWYLYTLRGGLYYQLGRYEDASADLYTAIDLGPEDSTPYVYAVLIAIRGAEVTEAMRLTEIIQTEYPDPSLANRVLSATFGDLPNFYGTTVEAFGNITLGRYERTIEVVDDAGVLANVVPELHLLQGIAECELGDFESAATSFQRTTRLDEELGLAYILWASAAQQVGDDETEDMIFDAMTTDIEGISAELPPFMDQFRDGTFTCADVF